MILNSKKSQTICEFAMFYVIIGAALVIFAVYLTQSFMGRYKQTADVFGEGEQFDEEETRY